MRNETATGFLAASRQVSASVTVKKMRPQFTRTTVTESGISIPNAVVLRYDAKYIAGFGFVRAIIARPPADGFHGGVFVCKMTDPTATPVWTNPANFVFQLLDPLDPETRRVDVCVTKDGDIVYLNGDELFRLQAPNWTFEPSIGAHVFPHNEWGVSLAGALNYDAFVGTGYPTSNEIDPEGYPDEPDKAGYPVLCSSADTANNTTGGCHFPDLGSWTKTAFVDSTSPSRGYLFVDSPNNNKIYFSYVNGIDVTQKNIFSPHQPLVPLDSADDEDSMRLLGANLIPANSTSGPTPVVVVDVTRKFGFPLLCILFGPQLDNPNPVHAFSWDRQLIVDGSYGDLFANVWATATFTYLVGFGFRYEITAFDRTLYEPVPTTIDGVIQLSGTFTINSPNTLAMECVSLPVGVDAGDEVIVKISANGDQVTLGTYGIDSIQYPNLEDGGKCILNLSSTAMKRLTQWTSDTSFEIFSQATSAGRIGELTKVVCSVGQVDVEEDETDGITIHPRNLNEDCILYSTDQSDHGGMMRGRFKIKVGNPYKAYFGLGIDYFEESLAECAARLNKKIDEVSASDCTKSGYFGVVHAIAGANAAAIKIFSYDSQRQYPAMPGGWQRDLWHELASTSFTMFEDAWYDVYVKGSEGHYIAGIKPDNVVTWADGAEVSFAVEPSGVSFPVSERRYYGRGAIYLRTNTIGRTAYAFTSDSTAIGIKEDMISDPLLALTNGTVVVDGEQIAFAAGAQVVNNLQTLAFSPGKIATYWTPASGGVLALSKVSTNTRYCQTITVTGSPYCEAIRLWLQKKGYPAEGVKVSLCRGPVSAANPFGTRLASATIPPEKISDAGGYTTAIFFTPAQIKTGDWIMLERDENPNGYSSTNYYTIKVADGYAGGNLYACAENGTWVLNAQEMLFQCLVSVDSWGTAYPVPVIWDGLLNSTADYYKDGALCVTDGDGAGTTYHIVKYTALVSDSRAVFYVDRAPVFKFSEGTTFEVRSSLYGLTRGVNGTLPSAHPDDSKVDLTGDIQRLQGEKFAHFSGGIDYTLQEVMEHVCRKAGVSKFRYNDLGGTVAFPNKITDTDAGNVILEVVPTTNNYKFTVSLRGDSHLAEYPMVFTIYGFPTSGSGANDQIMVAGTSTTGSLSGGTMASGHKVCARPRIRVSLQGEFFSVWADEHLIYGSYYSEEDYPFQLAAITMEVAPATGFDAVQVFIPEVNYLQDYYCIDLNKRGLSCLIELIGNKRVWLREGSLGTIDIFTGRTAVNASQTPADYAVTYTKTVTDNVLTRIMLEGAETVERTNMPQVLKYGNLFGVKSVPEVYTQADGWKYSNQFLGEELYAAERAQFSAAIDPRIEIGDTVWANTPAGGVRQIIVDSMNFTMNVTPDSAVMDMEAQGRVMP